MRSCRRRQQRCGAAARAAAAAMLAQTLCCQQDRIPESLPRRPGGRSHSETPAPRQLRWHTRHQQALSTRDAVSERLHLQHLSFSVQLPIFAMSAMRLPFPRPALLPWNAAARQEESVHALRLAGPVKPKKRGPGCLEQIAAVFTATKASVGDVPCPRQQRR